MRILIFGATGMLGHQLQRRFRERHETWAAMRRAPAPSLPAHFDRRLCLVGVDAGEPTTVARALDEARPDVVLNALGVVKQVAAREGAVACIQANALFPHQLEGLCADRGPRLIHVSTDCVFSGKQGRYTEDDPADPEDLYGRTKLVGELDGPRALTLRTSFIGPEIREPTGLLEWFLRRGQERVQGYTQAIYSGLSSIALAGVMLELVESHPDLAGLYHVSSDPISKYELLTKIREAFGLRTEITPHDGVRCDRSLDSYRFRSATRIALPSWDQMIAGLREQFEQDVRGTGSLGQNLARRFMTS